MRGAVIIYLSVVGAIFLRLVGPGRRRGRVMLAGTLGGFASGVLVANPMSEWLKMETSVVCVCLGLTIGWTMAWLLARRIPEAN